MREFPSPIEVIGPSIAYLPLTRGQYSCVELDDLPRLKSFRWNAVPRNEAGFYAKANMYVEGELKGVFMHRFLLGLGFGDKRTADHANRDGLDNRRRGNLREATRSQQQANKTIGKSNVSGFKGVYKKGNLYPAYIQVNRKRRRLGSHRDPAKAHELYVQAANRYYGEFARTE